MFQRYYAEQVIRDRQREAVRVLAWKALSRGAESEEERPVLSTDWSGWSLRRAGAVLGTVAVALAASVALPASLQGLAWGLREVLEIVSR